MAFAYDFPCLNHYTSINFTSVGYKFSVPAPSLSPGMAKRRMVNCDPERMVNAGLEFGLFKPVPSLVAHLLLNRPNYTLHLLCLVKVEFNSHWSIWPSGNSSSQRVSPLYEDVGSIPKIPKTYMCVSLY